MKKVKKAAKRGGKFCRAGAPNNVSCQNTSYTPGISMHQFPSDDKTRKKWVSFVHKHRPTFKLTKHAALCSAHFEESCYTRPLLELGSTEKSKRILITGSVPTRDTIIPVGAVVLTERRKRQVRFKRI